MLAVPALRERSVLMVSTVAISSPFCPAAAVVPSVKLNAASSSTQRDGARVVGGDVMVAAAAAAAAATTGDGAAKCA